MDLTTAIASLTSIGILPVIGVLAGLKIAQVVYARFAK